MAEDFENENDEMLDDAERFEDERMHPEEVNEMEGTESTEPAVEKAIDVPQTLAEQVGGEASDWKLAYHSDGFTFDGENIRDENGEIWDKLDPEMKAALVSEWQGNETGKAVFKLDDIVKDDKLFETVLILENWKVSYEIRETQILFHEEDEQERDEPRADALSFVSEIREFFGEENGSEPAIDAPVVPEFVEAAAEQSAVEGVRAEVGAGEQVVVTVEKTESALTGVRPSEAPVAVNDGAERSVADPWLLEMLGQESLTFVDATPEAAAPSTETSAQPHLERPGIEGQPITASAEVKGSVQEAAKQEVREPLSVPEVQVIARENAASVQRIGSVARAENPAIEPAAEVLPHSETGMDGSTPAAVAGTERVASAIELMQEIQTDVQNENIVAQEAAIEPGVSDVREGPEEIPVIAAAVPEDPVGSDYREIRSPDVESVHAAQVERTDERVEASTGQIAAITIEHISRGGEERETAEVAAASAEKSTSSEVRPAAAERIVHAAKEVLGSARVEHNVSAAQKESVEPKNGVEAILRSLGVPAPTRAPRSPEHVVVNYPGARHVPVSPDNEHAPRRARPVSISRNGIVMEMAA